eukprot:GHVP01004191.1.p1 GENE.GHVP01004191.1~~GHVP01004191.1.p1  ORF type:complete len:141 (+),score=9.99 GHVP01004191.1:666-1088(+)
MAREQLGLETQVFKSLEITRSNHSLVDHWNEAMADWVRMKSDHSSLSMNICLSRTHGDEKYFLKIYFLKETSKILQMGYHRIATIFLLQLITTVRRDLSVRMMYFQKLEKRGRVQESLFKSAPPHNLNFLETGDPLRNTC